MLLPLLLGSKYLKATYGDNWSKICGPVQRDGLNRLCISRKQPVHPHNFGIGVIAVEREGVAERIVWR